ncbi:V-type proton ATPase subunit a [Mycena kentingensis (nom. inval.)]|nr:V-type proton ATPase subunit a [Mycena kentingensis (nom. inval.)]
MSGNYPCLFRDAKSADDCVAEIGETGAMSFEELNPSINPFQRSFVGESASTSSRAASASSRPIEKEKDIVPVRPLYASALLITVGPRGPQTIDELDVSQQALSKRTKELVEAQHVRKPRFSSTRCVTRGHQTDIRQSFDDSSASLLQHDDCENELSTSSAVQFDLEFVTGTLDRTFDRVLRRVLRRNFYMNHGDIVEPFVGPLTGAETCKNVFAHGDALRATYAMSQSRWARRSTPSMPTLTSARTRCARSASDPHL